MTLYEFRLLSEHEQYDQVFNVSGVYLDNYLTDSLRFNLYAIDLFFVQVEYCRVQNKIIGLKSFKAGDLLNRYSNIKGLIWLFK